jgi:hypothetical protein
MDKGEPLWRIFGSLTIGRRIRKMLQEFGISAPWRRCAWWIPFDYLDFIHLEKHARLVLTDSGGIQEKTAVLRVPCLMFRERPVTLAEGTSVLVGTIPPGFSNKPRAGSRFGNLLGSYLISGTERHRSGSYPSSARSAGSVEAQFPPRGRLRRKLSLAVLSSCFLWLEAGLRVRMHDQLA